VTPEAFDNPTFSRNYQVTTDGSPGRGRRVLMDLDHLTPRLRMQQIVDMSTAFLAFVRQSGSRSRRAMVWTASCYWSHTTTCRSGGSRRSSAVRRGPASVLAVWAPRRPSGLARESSRTAQQIIARLGPGSNRQAVSAPDRADSWASDRS
jgi:hypothetical protein